MHDHLCKLKVGDIVHYVLTSASAHPGEHRPAIVTCICHNDEHQNCAVHLVVFKAHTNDDCCPGSPSFLVCHASFDCCGNHGTWHFPKD